MINVILFFKSYSLGFELPIPSEIYKKSFQCWLGGSPKTHCFEFLYLWQQPLDTIVCFHPSFKIKVWRQDVKCNKTRKTIWKEKLCMHERINKFTFCNIFEHPIFFSFHGCLSGLLLFFWSPLFYSTFVFRYSFKFFLWTLWSPLAFGDRCVSQFKKKNDGLILLYPHGTLDTPPIPCGFFVLASLWIVWTSHYKSPKWIFLTCFPIFHQFCWHCLIASKVFKMQDSKSSWIFGTSIM